MKTLYLIDAMSQIYRAYFTPAPELRSPDGEPTKATFIFTKILLKLLNAKQPDYLIVCFDARRSSLWRTQRYPEYKATRGTGEGIEDLLLQVRRIKEILRALELPIFKLTGYEADDLIAGCVRKWSSKANCVIVSRDHDLDQLLEADQSVVMFDPMTDTTRTYADVAAQGWLPEDVVTIKALTGDSSDNVPGVKGIGEKHAAGLVKKYKSLEAIYDAIEDHPPGIAKKLNAGRDSAFLSRDLVRLFNVAPIHCCPLDFDLEDLAVSTPDLRKASPLFRSLGFSRWA